MNKHFTLYSQGCCGTYQMRNRLKAIGLKTNWPTFNEHKRRPPKNCSHKILFMYADPRDILLAAVNKSTSNIWIRLHCEHLEGDYKYFDSAEKISIDQILNKMYDPLKLEKHFTNWLTTKIDYKIMMLKYESLINFNVFQSVLDFFDVDGSYDYNWRLRRTSYLSLPLKQQSKITYLFKNLLRIQSKLSLCFIR